MSRAPHRRDGVFRDWSPTEKEILARCAGTSARATVKELALKGFYRTYSDVRNQALAAGIEFPPRFREWNWREEEIVKENWTRGSRAMIEALAREGFTRNKNEVLGMAHRIREKNNGKLDTKALVR